MLPVKVSTIDGKASILNSVIVKSAFKNLFRIF